MTFKISPGVYPKLVDLTERPRPFATAIGVGVFASARGSLTPQFISDPVRFQEQYGKPDPTVGFGHDSLLAFLDESPLLWCLRVVGTGARWSSMAFINNYLSGSGPSAVYDGTSVATLNGSDQDYEDDGRQITDLIFSADLITGNVINLSVNNSAINPVTFSNSNNNTLRMIAQAIQSILDGLQGGGSVTVVNRLDTTQATHNRIIRIVAPTDITVTLTNIAVTSGSTQATAIQRDAEWIFKLYAENPGFWGNNVAAKISAIDQGQQQIIRLTFDTALISGNTFSGTINGVAITPVTFATNSNTTVQAIATAIQVALGGNSTAIPIEISGNNNNRQINIKAPDATQNMILENVFVTGGSGQPLTTYQEVRQRIAPDYTFNLLVYEGSLSTPVESWKVRLNNYVDGFGRQLNLAYQMNLDTRRSKRLRAVINPDIDQENVTLIPLNATTIDKTTGYGFLTGGDDGNAATNLQIVNGWDQFSDPEKVSVRILINCGYAAPEVAQKMDFICNHRRDCFAILDMPDTSQAPQDAVDYRNNILNIDSSYSAIYTPNVQIYDQNTGKQRFIPPSGLVAAQYAYNDRVSHEWFAPAGLNRGLIKKATALYYAYNEGDRDLLALAQINPIRKMGPRFPIWGEYTLQYRTSDLSSVPVRRLVITIETSLVDAVATSVFEPNDPFTRRRVQQMCEDFLLPIKNGRGLYEFKVVCNDSNNPPEIIDVRELHVDVYIKPVLAVLFLQLQTILTKTGANIDEIIAASNGGNF